MCSLIAASGAPETRIATMGAAAERSRVGMSNIEPLNSVDGTPVLAGLGVTAGQYDEDTCIIALCEEWPD